MLDHPTFAKRCLKHEICLKLTMERLVRADDPTSAIVSARLIYSLKGLLNVSLPRKYQVTEMLGEMLDEMMGAFDRPALSTMNF